MLPLTAHARGVKLPHHHPPHCAPRTPTPTPHAATLTTLTFGSVFLPPRCGSAPLPTTPHDHHFTHSLQHTRASPHTFTTVGYDRALPVPPAPLRILRRSRRRTMPTLRTYLPPAHHIRHTFYRCRRLQLPGGVWTCRVCHRTPHARLLWFTRSCRTPRTMRWDTAFPLFCVDLAHLPPHAAHGVWFYITHGQRRSTFGKTCCTLSHTSLCPLPPVVAHFAPRNAAPISTPHHNHALPLPVCSFRPSDAGSHPTERLVPHTPHTTTPRPHTHPHTHSF